MTLISSLPDINDPYRYTIDICILLNIEFLSPCGFPHMFIFHLTLLVYLEGQPMGENNTCQSQPQRGHHGQFPETPYIVREMLSQARPTSTCHCRCMFLLNLWIGILYNFYDKAHDEAVNIKIRSSNSIVGYAVVYIERLDRLGYPVSDIEIGIGDDDVTIECVDVIVSHIAQLCGDLNTRDKLAVSRKYQTA